MTPVRAFLMGAHPGSNIPELYLFGADTVSVLSVMCCAYLRCPKKRLNNTALAFDLNELFLPGKHLIFPVFSKREKG